MLVKRSGGGAQRRTDNMEHAHSFHEIFRNIDQMLQL